MIRKIFLCAILVFGALMGIPMRPDVVEETLKSMNRIKVERVVKQNIEPPK